MKILLAADHAGFEMKEKMKDWLLKHNYNVEDCGAHSFDSGDDYTVYMHSAGQKLSRFLKENAEHTHGGATDQVRAIVFGGSGTGEAIVCNRYAGIRAVVYNGQDPEIVRLGRAHNDANVLSVGARFVTAEQLFQAVHIFLNSAFEAGRHTQRVVQIDNGNIQGIVG
jgi:ribose 5-phosphate isomerase B